MMLSLLQRLRWRGRLGLAALIELLCRRVQRERDRSRAALAADCKGADSVAYLHDARLTVRHPFAGGIIVMRYRHGNG